MLRATALESRVTGGSRLSDTHAALLDDLHKLERSHVHGSGADMVQLGLQLGAVLARVKEHFRIEEGSGFLESLGEQQPRLGHAVQELLAEHCGLIDSLIQLIEKSKAVSSLDASIRKDIGEWITHIRQHESHEEDLIQEAYNHDLGAVD
jgi:hypothetical protein